MQTLISNGQGTLKEDTSEDKLLYDSFPPIRVLYNQAAAITGIDIPSVSFEGTIEERRRYQQLITFIKQAVLSTLVQGGMEVNHKKTIDLGFSNPIDSAMGLSLGEYNAWLSGNVMNYCAAVRAINVRNELMWPINNGGLSTYLGASRKDLEEACRQEGAGDLAILKCDGNYSVGAVSQVRERIYQRLKAEKKVKKLVHTDTRGAIHTGEFAETALEFAKFLWEFQENILVPSIDIHSGAYARPYRPDPEDFIYGGSDHLCKTFYFQQNVEAIIKPSLLKRGTKRTLLIVGQSATELEKIVSRISTGARKKWTKGLEKSAAAWDGLETKVVEDTKSVLKYWKEKKFTLNFKPKINEAVLGLNPA